MLPYCFSITLSGKKTEHKINRVKLLVGGNISHLHIKLVTFPRLNFGFLVKKKTNELSILLALFCYQSNFDFIFIVKNWCVVAALVFIFVFRVTFLASVLVFIFIFRVAFLASVLLFTFIFRVTFLAYVLLFILVFRIAIATSCVQLLTVCESLSLITIISSSSSLFSSSITVPVNL